MVSALGSLPCAPNSPSAPGHSAASWHCPQPAGHFPWPRSRGSAAPAKWPPTLGWGLRALAVGREGGQVGSDQGCACHPAPAGQKSQSLRGNQAHGHDATCLRSQWKDQGCLWGHTWAKGGSGSETFCSSPRTSFSSACGWGHMARVGQEIRGMHQGCGYTGCPTRCSPAGRRQPPHHPHRLHPPPRPGPACTTWPSSQWPPWGVGLVAGSPS